MSTRIFSMLLGEDGGKRPSVRRCLFGKTDRSIIDDALSLQEELLQAQDTKRFSERWGFNPVTQMPVDGAPYVCTPVDLQMDSIPEFYTKGYAPRKSKPVTPTREGWRGPYNRSLFADSQQVHSRRSVKRRLDLDDDQENQISSPKLFICARRTAFSTQSPQSSLPSHLAVPIVPSSSSSFTALTVPRPSSSPSLGSSSKQSHSRSSSRHPNSCHTLDKFVSPSLKKRYRLSPPSFLDLATPRSIEAQRTTPQRQTSMKDFFPTQKMRRATSAKSLFEV